MERFARLIDCDSTTFALCEYSAVTCYEQVYTDECPEGFKPLECIKPYPVPGDGEELAFEITHVGDHLVKTGIIVPAGTRYHSPVSGGGEMADVSMTSPNGRKWQLGVNDDGTLYTMIKEAE